MTQQDLQREVEPAAHDTKAAGRVSILVNWVLALLTVPLAIAVVLVAIGGVMSIAGCSGPACTAPSSFWFGVLFYGAPVLSAATIVASFFTARRRWGIAVPLCALALLVIDGIVLVASF